MYHYRGDHLKKILILTSRYLPNPSANGINTKYIVDELRRRDYDVTCLSVKEKDEKSFELIDGIPIYRVSPSFYSKLSHLESSVKMTKLKKIGIKDLHFCRKIKLALLILKFPNFDLLQTKKVYKLIEILYKKDQYDCIIGINKPFSNIAALKKFKKEHPDVLCGGYYLDLINSSQKPAYMPRRIYQWLCKRGDLNIFKIMDFVLLAKGGKDLYTRSDYDKVREKIAYIDFPTLTLKKDAKHGNIQNNKRDTLVLTYAGTLNRDYRNPSYLLKCLDAASLALGNIELHIYGIGNCDDIIGEYSKSKTLTIIRHGFQAHDVVIKSMMNSDFLVNVSNKMQNAVPSKIFEMFSIGKPIINLVFDKGDITTQYFDRYPAVFNIEIWNNSQDQAQDLIKFINKEKENTYDYEKIKMNYLENTPEYTVDIIEKRIEEKVRTRL